MFIIPETSYEVRRAHQKGRGVFVKRNIKAGALIGDYLGRIVDDKELVALEKENGGACYAMDYDGNDTSIYPEDVRIPDVHLINHSCAPNCGTCSRSGHTLVFALRRLFPGEELSFDYGFDPDGAEALTDHPCCCGSPICRGTMYASAKDIDRYIAFIARTTKKQKYTPVKGGEMLPPLKNYPQQIPDDSYYDVFANLERNKKRYADKKQPPLGWLRRQLRESGRALSFPHLSLIVWGVRQGEVLAFRQEGKK